MIIGIWLSSTTGTSFCGPTGYGYNAENTSDKKDKNRLTNVNPFKYYPWRIVKPIHKKKTLRQLIKSGNVLIKKRAVQAKQDLRWSNDEILEAILRLDPKDCIKTLEKRDNPTVHYDYYRTSKPIFGELIYTHFYIENGYLVIDSIKRR